MDANPILAHLQSVACSFSPPLYVKLQGDRPSGAGDDGDDASAMTGARRDGGGRVRVYLHAVTDKQVYFFTDNSKLHFKLNI